MHQPKDKRQPTGAPSLSFELAWAVATAIALALLAPAAHRFLVGL